MKSYTNLCTLLCMLVPFAGITQPGTLDESFGQGGKVLTIPASGSLGCFKVLVQKDNKILAAGTYGTIDYRDGFSIVRYLPDGSIDSTFGEDGVARTDFNSVIFGGDAIYDMAIQPDGKIVGVGYFFLEYTRTQYGDYQPNWDVCMARYMPDGSLV